MSFVGIADMLVNRKRWRMSERDSLTDEERGRASAIAVLALEGTLSRSDMLVLHSMFGENVLREAHEKMEGRDE